MIHLFQKDFPDPEVNVCVPPLEELPTVHFDRSLVRSPSHLASPTLSKCLPCPSPKFPTTLLLNPGTVSDITVTIECIFGQIKSSILVKGKTKIIDKKLNKKFN